MDPFPTVFAALVGYMVGSISFARVITKVVAPEQDIDVIEIELPGGEAAFQSNAVSATTVRLHLGRRYGCLVSMLDMLKAFVPTLAVKLAWPDDALYLIVAGMVTVGHIWPVFHRFKGGRGLSPILGGMLVLDWLGVMITNLIGLIAGTFLGNNLVVLTGTGIVLMIPWIWIRSSDPAQVAYVAAMNLLYWTAMIPEWREYYRLWREGELKGFNEAEELRVVRRRGNNVVENLTFPRLLSKLMVRFRRDDSSG
jgi:glycerol-3-phosphate acyltransferase PlsY